MPGKYEDVRPDVMVVLSEIKNIILYFSYSLIFYLVLQAQRDAGFLTLFSSCI